MLQDPEESPLNSPAGPSEAEQIFRSAFTDAPIGMGLVSVAPGTAGRFVKANRALCELTGHAEEDLLRLTFAEITHPEDRETEEELVARLVLGEIPRYELEKRLLCPNGEMVWVKLHCSLLRHQSGQPLHLLTQVEDITERRRFEEKLRHLAEHDPLTGLLNRRRFAEELATHVALARRYGGGAVLVLDLDNFKYVNDSVGHVEGDALLARIAGILRDRLRQTDVLARIGGDEFAIILPHVDEEQTRIVAATLGDAVRSELEAYGGWTVTMSIGVARMGGEGAPEEVLVAADDAMYRAKSAGKDGYAVAEPSPQNGMRVERSALRIRDALERGSFVLHGQPIVELASGAPVRYELLLRMNSEEPLVEPGEFLPSAERFGLVTAIDRWVLRAACRVAARSAGDGLPLAVNISDASVTDHGLLEAIEEAAAFPGVDPGSLVFEITETAAIMNFDKAVRFATRVSELGFGLALDDFGAGFGSFFYLKHLPFDYLKIDGGFIRNLRTSETDRTIVGAIVDIAHGFGKKTIAEHVEDAETLDALRTVGVDYAQGYHTGRPCPLDEILVRHL